MKNRHSRKNLTNLWNPVKIVINLHSCNDVCVDKPSAIYLIRCKGDIGNDEGNSSMSASLSNACQRIQNRAIEVAYPSYSFYLGSRSLF
jgi:hypothetical protein